jgi:hypothetical protein
VSKKGWIARSSGTSGSVSSGWACPIFCRQRHVDHWSWRTVSSGYSKRSIHFQKFILQNILKLKPCPVCRWKGNFSKFWYWWSEVAHHWGCGCCYLWHAATNVGKAGLLIWHLPRHTWGSQRVLVRCGNNFESSPFGLYITCRHMFNSTCKINFWKCILFWITLPR